MNEEHIPSIEIPGFRLIERIARGGMGSVYRAWQISIDRQVAVKLLAPTYAKDRVFVERFLREARAAAQLNHPNIVQALDVGQAGGRYYFVMEHVEGDTLSAILRKRKKFDPVEACEIVRQTARALEHAGRFGMVHLDVKPNNIMLSRSGLAKLADFGLARHIEDKDILYAEKQVVFGTPAYMSPEQIAGESNLDGRSDIWSLGVMFYELLTGSNPFKAEDKKSVIQKVRWGDIPSAHEVDPRVSLEMSCVIAKMLSRNREDRYADAAALLVDLDALSRGQPPPIALDLPPASALLPPMRQRQKLSLPILTALVITFVSLTATIAVLWHYRHARRLPPQKKPTHLPVAKAPPKAAEDPVLRLFRERTADVERLVAAGKFTDALAVYEEFASQHGDSRWAEEARSAADAVRNQAMTIAKAAIETIQEAIRQNDFQTAQARLEELRTLGLDETNQMADAGLQQLEIAKAAARRREEQEKENAARLAAQQLWRELIALSRSEEFEKGAEACRAFLNTPDFVSRHKEMAGWEQKFSFLHQIQRAILNGADKSEGTSVLFRENRARIVRTEKNKILLRTNGRQIWALLQDLAPDDLSALARKGAPDQRAAHTGLAFLLYTQKRYTPAIQHAELAKSLTDNAYEEFRIEAESGSLLPAAAQALEAEDAHSALLLFRRMKRDYGHTSIYQTQKRRARSLLNQIEQILYRDMRRVAGGIYQERKDETRIAEFYMDTHEVTNAQYSEFLRSLQLGQPRAYDHPQQPPSKKDHVPLEWEKFSKGRPEHPVVGVDWYDAYAYARWRGKRLPRAEEWSYAASGPRRYMFPWGNRLEADKMKTRIANTRPVVMGPDTPVPDDVMPVGSFSIGPRSENLSYGCRDMAGNAREWVDAANDNGTTALVYGGSFKDNLSQCSAASRVKVSRLTRDPATGFRCAMTPIEDRP